MGGWGTPLCGRDLDDKKGLVLGSQPSLTEGTARAKVLAMRMSLEEGRLVRPEHSERGRLG